VSIALTNNYRSSQNILDLAHALITAVPSPAAALRVPLRAQTKESGVIEKRVFAHEAVEDDALVARVESLVLGGTPRSEIAVIVRTNREVDTLAARIRARGITVMASADTDILAHPITKTIEGLMSVVTEPENEEALFRVLHEPFWHIAPGDLVKLFRARSFDTPLASLIARDDMLEALALEDPASISRVHAVITGARANATIDAPHRVLEYLVRESGLLAHLMATDPLEGMRVVRRLYDEVETLLLIKQTTTMRDVNALFRMRVEHTLPLTAPYIYVDPDAVRVMTAHKSKGLEFSHVFIPHLTENHWGDPRRKTFFKIPLTKELRDEGFDEIDDERKLLYVALTRAKRGLYLSSAEENSEGKPLSPTLLLEDIGEGLITHLSTEAESRAFDAAGVMRERVTRAPIDAALLRSSLTERGLSATSLNNYLKSPWDYFYRNVLRIPETKDESLLFGTALHDVLCRALRYRAEHEELPSASRVKEYLERELGKLPLTVAEYTRLHARGLEALTLYLAHCGADLPPVTREEVKFEARLPTGLVEFPEVLLTGKLDRLDFDAPPEEGGKLIRVIDYKTGKPKTKGQIEGTTKDSNGGYKRQLVFYALLLSLQDDARYQSRDGLLAFIEPDGKGKIREERYTISDDEIEALRADIIRIVGEIANGAFLSSPCDPETSKYCDLVELLRRERA
jgi:DNA helicase-2/ATP-dependent DNA helicase PcrA